MAETQRRFSTAAKKAVRSTKESLEKQIRDYHQLQSPAATNPGHDSGNPYLTESPEVNQPEMNSEVGEAVECTDITTRTHWLVKSVTPIKRIFMIDVQSRGMFKTQINLTMHFVNKCLNPGEPPKIKQYLFSNGMTNYKDEMAFMEKLEDEAKRLSKYYNRMKKVKQGAK